VSTRNELSEAVESIKAVVYQKKEKYERKYGIIQWDSNLEFDYYNSKIVIAPSIMENETYVNSLLFASYSANGQVKYKFYDRDKILNAKEKNNASKSNNKYTELTKELGLALLIHMDTELYGKTDCDLANQLDNIRTSSTTRAYCTGYIIVKTTTNWVQVNGDGTTRELDPTTSYDYYNLCTEGNSDSYEDEYGDPTPPADPYEDVPEDNSITIYDIDGEEDDKEIATIRNGFGLDLCASESFNFRDSGIAGWTASVGDIFQGYIWNLINIRTFKIPEMCIQVPKTIGFNGPHVDDELASQFVAEAYNDARFELFELLQLGLYSLSSQAKAEFRNLFLEQLRDKFGLVDNSNAVTVSYSACSSSFYQHRTNLHYSTIFGCLKSKVE